MAIKDDAFLLAVAVAAVAALAWYAKRQISAVVPQAVKDGVEAAGVMAWQAAQAVAHPLDAFGVAPGTFADGTPKYSTTAPYLNLSDVVSNAPGGINYNLF